MDAAQIFAEVFPIAAGSASLELVEARDQDNGSLRLTVRIILWAPGEDGTRTIRDVKEQDVYVIGPQHRGDPRLAACVAGWAEAVRFVFEQDDEGGRFACIMPHDLIVVGSLLALKRPRTADDFTAAALAGKQRLGRFVREV
jgi:hypothetical protein